MASARPDCQIIGGMEYFSGRLPSQCGSFLAGIPRLPRTCADHGWTTSPMPSPWTATNSVPCWSPPGSARRPSTRWSPCSPRTAAGLRSHRRRHRASRPRTRAPDPDHHPLGRQGRHHPARTAHGTGDRPGHRRAHRRAGVPGCRQAAAGPAWRRADRPQGRAGAWCDRAVIRSQCPGNPLPPGLRSMHPASYRSDVSTRYIAATSRHMICRRRWSQPDVQRAVV